jgi:hypothetical protein
MENRKAILRWCLSLAILREMRCDFQPTGEDRVLNILKPTRNVFQPIPWQTTVWGQRPRSTGWAQKQQTRKIDHNWPSLVWSIPMYQTWNKKMNVSRRRRNSSQIHSWHRSSSLACPATTAWWLVNARNTIGTCRESRGTPPYMFFPQPNTYITLKIENIKVHLHTHIYIIIYILEYQTYTFIIAYRCRTA